MDMFEGRETPTGILALVIDEIILAGGLRQAFPHNGLVLLYSGPDWRFHPDNKESTCVKFVGRNTTNGKRTKAQQRELDWNSAKRLDDTPIGKFLFETNNLYEWLDSVHRKEPDKEKRDALVDSDAKEVMTHVSALFARAAHGHVKTAICGADRSRVFYETEIPNLVDCPSLSPEAATLVREILDNKDVETINCVPADVFRAIYKRDGLETVYQRICLTELRERWLYAHSTGNKNDFADYVDRLEIHRINQYENCAKHAVKPLRPSYLELLKTEDERIDAREQRILKFVVAKAPGSGIPTPTRPSPMCRVAGVPGHKRPLS